MKVADISQIEQRLATILEKERREAIGYTILTVLCTPVFVALAGFVVLIILSYIFYSTDNDYFYQMDMIGFYTILNVFLALMIVIILKHTFSPQEEYEFDITWLVAVVIFLLLLLLTYATKFPDKFPAGFGIIYTVTGFLILGLLGRVYLNLPVVECDDRDHPFYTFILAVTGFIAMSYGELLSGSWLWIPPKPDEVRICAWFLCKLALEEDISHRDSSVPKRVLYILSRLKFIRAKEGTLELTQKGRELVLIEGNN